MMSMRLVAALDVQHQREETLGGKIPYGYCLAAHGVALAEYPEEQAMRCLLSYGLKCDSVPTALL